MNGKAFSEADDEAIRKLHGDGLSTAEIGRRINRSKGSIVGRCRRLGLEARPDPSKPDEALDKKALELKARGLATKEIAREMKVKESSVKARLRRLRAAGHRMPLSKHQEAQLFRDRPWIEGRYWEQD